MVLRELAVSNGAGQEDCQVQLALLDLATLACTDTWRGPRLQQQQQFWVGCLPRTWPAKRVQLGSPCCACSAGAVGAWSARAPSRTLQA